ncbi:MAG: glycosyltransferase family 2 protein [Planctomycetaceae bacterium]|nr:glycosyltransferase family 2 protein [Planctomycetaceae bacterium]
MNESCDLTIVTATWNRPKWLRNCCEQIRRQSLAGVSWEHIVVSDGPDEIAERIARNYSARFDALSQHVGDRGASGNNRGLELARGRYIVFFDDDNLYHTHALAALYAAAQNVEIGVCQTRHKGQIIPPSFEEPLRFGQVDSMCLCVMTDFARREQWPYRRGSTDWGWLERLMKHKPRIRITPIVIGEHLT